MTRSEAIALINASLKSLDDKGVSTVADIVQSLTGSGVVPLHLSDEERAAIDRSREDFRAGRTHSLDEARELTDAFLGSLGVLKSNR